MESQGNTVAIYCRVATREQAEDTMPVRAQEQACMQLVKSLGFSNVTAYRDIPPATLKQDLPLFRVYKSFRAHDNTQN